jgi:hypothetical protein
VTLNVLPRGGRWRAVLYLAAAHTLVSCESPTGIPFPSNAIRFTPPSIYREWWTLTEECSGRSASFDDVAWYVAPTAYEIPRTNGLAGIWVPDGNRIVLAGGYDGVSDGELVRHEMLHAILHGGGHPRDMFVGRCQGVVVCIDECVTESSPPQPDPLARPEPPTALEVTVNVVPITPSSATWDGYFMMIIHARNPASYPVVVQLPPSGDAGPPVSFSYRLQSLGANIFYDMREDYPEVTRFGAGETKQFIFDFHNVQGSYRYDLSPGTWTFNGAYGEVWTSSPPIVSVGP